MMGFNRFILNGIGPKKANELTKNSSSLCGKVTKEQKMTISPTYIGSIREGIAEQLKSHINQYDHELKGIVLAYENVNIISPEASLMVDRPFLFLTIKATYIIFQPKIGSLLTGVIKEIKESHVVCVVHEIFNATIFQSKTHAWNVSSLKLGENIVFEVTEISKNSKIFFLKGKLAAPLSNCQTSIDDSNPLIELNDSTTMKEKQDENDAIKDTEENVEKNCLNETSINESAFLEDSTELMTEDQIDLSCSEPRKKKKKKKKHRNSDEME